MRRLLPRSAVMVLGAVLVVLALTAGAFAVTGSDGPSYRMATAGKADVEETVSTSGTVDPVDRADVTAPVDGTLAKVTARLGQHVRAGAKLARFDATALTAALNEAQAELAAARAQLEHDQDAQATTVADGAEPPAADTPDEPDNPASGQTGSKPGSGTGSSTGSPAVTKALKELAAQQQEVSQAQSTTGKAIATARVALAAQTKACADAFTTPSSDEPAGTDANPTDSKDDQDTKDTKDTACTDALAAVETAQGVVAEAQDTLQAALTKLTGTLTGAIKAVTALTADTGKAPQNTPQDAPQDATAQESSGDRSGSSPTGTTPTGKTSAVPTAAQLAADQARIDEAKAAVLNAQRARQQATITAPISGTIARIAAAKGDRLRAGDPVLVIVGKGSINITGTIPVEDIGSIKVGQPARVRPAGATTTVPGTVTAIGTLPDTSAEAPAYPVTVTVNSGALLPTGSTAGVDIVTGTAKDVVTVPTSAVHTAGATHTVTVLEGGEPVPAPVEVGIVDSTRTQITSGLKAGAEVVLADLSRAVPTSNSGMPQGGFGGGGVSVVVGKAGGGPGGGLGEAPSMTFRQAP